MALAAVAAAPTREIKGGELEVDGVSKLFRTRRGIVQALDNISLRVAPGGFVCLVGPSGCGKSTLLDIIAGLTRPDTGRVTADGIPVTGPDRQRLVMFQESALFPWLDTLGNVLFGLKLVPGLTRRQRIEIAMEHLRLVKLERFARANIHELSGGMRQRVALARALAPDPRVLLMDEPFSALDALTREQLYDDLQDIWHARRKTVLLVTHNVREAACLGDRVVLLSPNPGRVRATFDIDLPRPRDINDQAISGYATRITAVLKSYYAPEAVL
ncbi:MAG TPA: ABC transporter ATP-binding protein [Acidisphaera sp.]|nr:ABC transporter ATP-binding protein [Acidisphaera sp.]